jgi:hypothetical protein
MREAKITCHCETLSLRDLGISMLRGDTETISEDDFKRSGEVKHALGVKAISVQWVEGPRTVRKPEAQRRRPPRQTHRTTRPGASATPAPTPPQVDMAALKGMVEEVVSQMPQVDLEEVRRIFRQEGDRIVRDLSAVVAQLNVQVPVGGPAQVPVAGETLPPSDEGRVFVPSDLVPSEGKVEASSVKEGDEAGGQVDDAVAALRASRKKTKKRTTRRTTKKKDDGEK